MVSSETYSWLAVGKDENTRAMIREAQLARKRAAGKSKTGTQPLETSELERLAQDKLPASPWTAGSVLMVSFVPLKDSALVSLVQVGSEQVVESERIVGSEARAGSEQVESEY